MKPSEVIVVFMSIGECADTGYGTTIVEVFEKKDKLYAEALASEIREITKKKWGWEDKELSEGDKRLLHGIAEIITLEEAIKKIEDDIHDGYASFSPDY